MSFNKNLPISFSILFGLYFTFTNAATFNVVNQCGYPVWAAAVPGGGMRLDRGQTWTFNVAPGTTQARIWGRRNCNFDAGGRGHCETGDCNGLLRCQNYGKPPNTLAEFALNQPNNLDYIDISLVDGFNIPMTFTGIGCRDIICNARINDQCPPALKVPGGCNNPCTTFGGNQYCCTNGPGSCGPTEYSRFFKTRCPTSYSYPQDDRTSVFTCPGGTNYRVVFCS
ncbi:hypothetical protein LguiA_034272 [Lonicera macranthoides]